MAGTRVPRRAVSDPPWVASLLGDTRWAWLWAIVRVYVGYQWFEAGLHKVTDPAWVRTGAALQAYWQRAVQIPAQGKPPVTYDWYREFLTFLLNSGSHTWFAKLVAYGELVMGIFLIVGLFTGFAAFFGAFANFNFMLAGSASTNPVLFLLAVLLMLAWKIAGYWGLDYWVLPAVGTPWKSVPTTAPERGG